ncbi:MAG: hypothetical protein DRJ10_01115 [Bacteroidetes bacterium]|nr:MAG: hypothetical protein DRJ10_01115 [Bacteroidota bacterium]
MPQPKRKGKKMRIKKVQQTRLGSECYKWWLIDFKSNDLNNDQAMIIQALATDGESVIPVLSQITDGVYRIAPLSDKVTKILESLTD